MVLTELSVSISRKKIILVISICENVTKYVRIFTYLHENSLKNVILIFFVTDILQSTSVDFFYCQFICVRRRPLTIYIQKMRHKYIVKNIFNEFSTFYLYVSTLQKFCLLLQFLAVHKILKGICTLNKIISKK